jgi:hypothetical protein
MDHGPVNVDSDYFDSNTASFSPVFYFVGVVEEEMNHCKNKKK